MLAEPEEKLPRGIIIESRANISRRESELRSRSLIEEWARTSWIDSANDAVCGFPLQSLPYCVYAAKDGHARIGVGIGAFVLDLQHCARGGLFEGIPSEVQAASTERSLNALMTCDAAAHASLRRRLMDLLDAGVDGATREAVGLALTPIVEATLLKPVEAANYTDFYASIHHATRVGRLFRPEQPLLPNYKFVPIGYHGRASSLVVGGTPVRRPHGQTKPVDGGVPSFCPTKFLDYEVEVGVYIAGGNSLGTPVGIDRAGERIFGLSLVNDWSARDVQSWEYQPLGPFLGKSFATSVSPWVAPMAALEPFRVPVAERAAGDPAPLPYLFDEADQARGAINLTLEALLITTAMRAAGDGPYRLSSANLRDLYWTPAQMIAHHTSNGCNLLPGDLLATGTVSGAEESSAGCLLELTGGGKLPIQLPNGETRTALEDGDEMILRGYCRREGYPRVSVGECRGLILPAV
jgi:fumarylacetoacetase